jgi:hypothetical protein
MVEIKGIERDQSYFISGLGEDCWLIKRRGAGIKIKMVKAAKAKAADKKAKRRRV